jgi:hypothetical protein
MRQFGVEAVMLAATALGLAALAAPGVTAWIVRVLPAELTLGQVVEPDVRALLFAAALSVAGVLLLTLLPIDVIRRSSPVRLLRGSVGGGLDLRAAGVRRGLFVAQLAIGTTLVYLTCLATTSFLNVATQPLGFPAEGLYVIRMPRGHDVFTGRGRLAERGAVVDSLLDQLRALPGVSAVAGANAWPMRPDSIDELTVVPDADLDRTPIVARRVSVRPGYAGTLGIPIVAGAEPTTIDLEAIRSARDQWLVVVNESLARQIEPFGPAVGQVLSARWKVVGIVPDVRLGRPDRPAGPTVFLYLPPTAAVNALLLRLDAGRTPEELGIGVVLARSWGADAPTPFPVVDEIHRASAQHRARVLLLGLGAWLTIPVTALGVSGALTYKVRQQGRETAIELAIGAAPQRIRRRVVRDAITAAVLAAACGLVAGTILGAAMSSSLFGVSSLEPLSAAIAGLLTVVVAWMAAVVPAYRAGRADLASVFREA